MINRAERDQDCVVLQINFALRALFLVGAALGVVYHFDKIQKSSGIVAYLSSPHTLIMVLSVGMIFFGAYLTFALRTRIGADGLTEWLQLGSLVFRRVHIPWSDLQVRVYWFWPWPGFSLEKKKSPRFWWYIYGFGYSKFVRLIAKYGWDYTVHDFDRQWLLKYRPKEEVSTRNHV